MLKQSARYSARYATLSKKRKIGKKLDCIPNKCLTVSLTLSSKSASSQSLSMKKTSLFSGSGEDWDSLGEGVPRGVS